MAHKSHTKCFGCKTKQEFDRQLSTSRSRTKERDRWQSVVLRLSGRKDSEWGIIQSKRYDCCAQDAAFWDATARDGCQNEKKHTSRRYGSWASY